MRFQKSFVIHDALPSGVFELESTLNKFRIDSVTGDWVGGDAFINGNGSSVVFCLTVLLELKKPLFNPLNYKSPSMYY